MSPSARRPGREARNEQRKLTANVFNALAITLFITALAGPTINPELQKALGGSDRLAMVGVAFLAHLVALAIARDIEDKT